MKKKVFVSLILLVLVLCAIYIYLYKKHNKPEVIEKDIEPNISIEDQLHYFSNPNENFIIEE